MNHVLFFAIAHLTEGGNPGFNRGMKSPFLCCRLNQRLGVIFRDLGLLNVGVSENRLPGSAR